MTTFSASPPTTARAPRWPDGSRARRRRDRDFALRAKHDPRRRFCALHRPSIARHAAAPCRGQPVRQTARSSLESGGDMHRDLGHHRTRFAPVPAQPGAHDRFHHHAAGAARRARLCVRRKNQKPQVGVVDEDHGVPAIKLKEMFQAVAANAQTFDTMAYSDKAAALRDLRNGKINGVLEHSAGISRAKFWPARIRASRWWRTTRTSSPPPRWKAR
jgi:hypothetical protein